MPPTEMAPIFIVGVPRSGTTLLSAMLNAHPAVAISPETFFLEWALQRDNLDPHRDRDFERFWNAYSASEPFERLNLDEALLRDRLRDRSERSYAAIFGALMASYAQSRGKRRCGEKTPRHYLYVETLRDWFPRATVIFVVRDPRAVGASLLRVPWASDDIEEHAWRWRRSDEILTELSGDPHVLAVRYEDLVIRPREELARICAAIQEPFDEAMLRFAESAEDLVGDEAHKGNVLRPLSTESLERWRVDLTGRQIAIVEQINWDAMERWRYEHLSTGLGLGDRIVVRARYLLQRAEAAGRRRLGGGSTAA